jgi:hypothetical protein
MRGSGDASEAQVIPRGEVDPLRRRSTNRSPAFVIGDRLRNAQHLEAGVACAQAELDVFEREEEFFVEQSRFFEHVTLHEHRAAAYRVDAVRTRPGQERNRAAGSDMAHPARAQGKPDASRGDAIRFLS